MPFKRKSLKISEKLKRALSSAKGKARRRVIEKYLRKIHFRKKKQKE